MRGPQVRIIAGRWRSRRLRVASGVRPSLDAHRETLFNVIGAILPGSTCVDLFAGSGAMGLEALSRGAGHVTFVESSARVAGVLRANVRALDTEGASSTVVGGDALRFIRGRHETRYGVAFLDPPYDQSSKPGWWPTLLGRLAAVMAPGGTACCEGPARIVAPSGWGLVREGRNGAACWSVLSLG